MSKPAIKQPQFCAWGTIDELNWLKRIKESHCTPDKVLKGYRKAFPLRTDWGKIDPQPVERYLKALTGELAEAA